MRADRDIAAALGAAVLFGLSTPLAKELVGEAPPLLLAGLLYLGSGLGLAVLLGVRVATDRNARITWPRGAEARWLLGAILAGGVLGPFLLMHGLRTTDAASASLILNLEGVFTALLAWFVFKENFDRRIALGMAAIVAGGVVLSAGPAMRAQGWIGPLAIGGACLAWAIDNNLTRRISTRDAMLIACAKGLAAGSVSVALALATGSAMASVTVALQAGLLASRARNGANRRLFLAGAISGRRIRGRLGRTGHRVVDRGRRPDGDRCLAAPVRAPRARARASAAHARASPRA